MLNYNRPYVLNADRELNGLIYASEGDTVYPAHGTDYGLARTDSIVLGEDHVSVTKDTSGGYPFFTIPVRFLDEKVEA